MASENAKAAAKEILTTIRKGLKVNKGEILRRHGYSDSVSKKPKKVLATDTFQETIKPVVKALENEREAILERMKKTRNKAHYRDLTYSLDIVTKNHQLLSGGRTENTGVELLAISLDKLISNSK